MQVSVRSWRSSTAGGLFVPLALLPRDAEIGHSRQPTAWCRSPLSVSRAPSTDLALSVLGGRSRSPVATILFRRDTRAPDHAQALTFHSGRSIAAVDASRAPGDLPVDPAGCVVFRGGAYAIRREWSRTPMDRDEEMVASRRPTAPADTAPSTAELRRRARAIRLSVAGA